jgi:DNA transformation protein
MKDDSFKEFVVDQLRELEGTEARRMFGGYGLYCRGTFFGIISANRLYFKTDEQSRGDYIEEGMQPFTPSAKQTLKNYYEVPPDIIEDREKLSAWTRHAAAVNKKS